MDKKNLYNMCLLIFTLITLCISFSPYDICLVYNSLGKSFTLDKLRPIFGVQSFEVGQALTPQLHYEKRNLVGLCQLPKEDISFANSLTISGIICQYNHILGQLTCNDMIFYSLLRTDKIHDNYIFTECQSNNCTSILFNQLNIF